MEKEIDKLANFIMNEVDGEPSKSESAVDCAIRIIKEYESNKLSKCSQEIATIISNNSVR